MNTPDIILGIGTGLCTILAIMCIYYGYILEKQGNSDDAGYFWIITPFVIFIDILFIGTFWSTL